MLHMIGEARAAAIAFRTHVAALASPAASAERVAAAAVTAGEPPAEAAAAGTRAAAAAARAACEGWYNLGTIMLLAVQQTNIPQTTPSLLTLVDAGFEQFEQEVGEVLAAFAGGRAALLAAGTSALERALAAASGPGGEGPSASLLANLAAALVLRADDAVATAQAEGRADAEALARRAEAAARAALAREPRLASAHVNLGRALLLRAATSDPGEHRRLRADAVHALEVAVQLGDASARALLSQAVAHTQSVDRI